MSGSSRRFSQRNLQRPASQPVTPVRRVQATPREDNPTPSVVFDVASANPTNNFLIGLREIVLKALLSDIEASGGFSAPTFSLKQICNSKPDIYGPPGSEQRRQVQNKVTKLRKLPPFQYLSVLNYYSVNSGALTRSFRPLDFAASVSEESLSEPVTPVRLQRRAVAHPSPRLEQHQLVPFESPSHRLQRSPSRHLHSAARRLAMNTQLLFEEFNPDDVDVITVNLEQPERNREVMVFTVNDVQNQGNMYNCFTIMLRIDPRDAAVTDRCTAYVVSETEILISYPALEYFFFTDSAARNERLKVGTDYDPQVQLAQDICINDVRRAPQRVVKRLLLQFPEGVTLANVFNQYSYVIRSKMPMDYASTGLFGKEPVKVLTTHMQWMIADLNTHRQAVIEAAEATPLDLLSANFARMFETTSGNMSVAAPIAHSPFATPTKRSIPLPTLAQPSATALSSLNAIVVAPVPQAAAMQANPFATSSTRSSTLDTPVRMSLSTFPFAATTLSNNVFMAPAYTADIHANKKCAAPDGSNILETNAIPSLTTRHNVEAVVAYLNPTPPCAHPHNSTMQLPALSVTGGASLVPSAHVWNFTTPIVDVSVPNVKQGNTHEFVLPMKHATMSVNDVGFVIGGAQVKRHTKMRPIEIDKRRSKRPPSGSTPMRKELGSPRKRNCTAANSMPLMLEDALHPNTRQRSSPRLQETVPTVSQPSQAIKDMDNEDANDNFVRIDKRSSKRPPSGSTPMRKELGSPRKRNCTAADSMPLMLEDALHPNTKQRSSPRLQEMVLTVSQPSQGIVDMNNEAANSKKAAYVLHPLL